MTEPLSWDDTIVTILGAENDVDDFRVSNPAWIGLDMSFWDSRESTEGSWQSPWNHWMPNGNDWNKITLYRYRNNGSKVINFQLIRATVYFYEGGDDSPAKQAKLLMDTSQAIIDALDTNEHLDPAMFRAVATRFRNVQTYLTGNGQAPLRAMYDEIDGGGAFEGSAADAFAWAMRDMALGMEALAENIAGRFLVNYNHYVNTGWPYVLDEVAEAIDSFRERLRYAWETYSAWTYYDPNTLVDALLKSMENQVDDAYTHGSRGQTGDRQESWTFDFSTILAGTDNTTYDLIRTDEWVRLNTNLKKVWTDHYDDLDETARSATRNLITAYNQLLAAFGRGVIALPHLPYPGANPFGNNPPGSLPPPANVGNGPPETGGSNGSIPPPPEGGGFEGGAPPPSGSGAGLPPPGGGSGLEVGGSGFGSGGSGGSGPDGGGLGSGGFAGGSGGLDGSLLGSGGSGAGGLGTGGLGTGSLGTAGLIGGGLSTGGLGAGGSGSGSLGSGGGRGVRGSGSASGVDDDLGLGSGGMSGGGLVGGVPSPLDPGGFGGSGGLTPDRPGGAVLGPLGTPPAGYVPTGLSFPAAAVAGGALSSGGANLAGLPGAMAIATPAAGDATGAGGMGMPFMPMGGMGGGGAGRDAEKERERTTWLAEEEEVWGTDAEVTAAVIGRDETEHEPTGRPTRRPAPPRTPLPTNEPARGRGQR